MSEPARVLEQVAPAAPRVPPTHTPAARPPRATPPHADRRARRGSPVAFWILVAFVAAVSIIGIAALSALLVQSSFTVDTLRSDLGTLQQDHDQLREEVAAASSPHRVMQWARQRGMQTPEHVVILPLPAEQGGSAP